MVWTKCQAGIRALAPLILITHLQGADPSAGVIWPSPPREVPEVFRVFSLMVETC